MATMEETQQCPRVGSATTGATTGVPPADETWSRAYPAGSLAGSHRNHRGQDQGVVEEREDLMSEYRLAHRIVGHVDVGDGEARAHRQGEIGEVALLRALLAGEVEPSGRFFGSIVHVGVVERVGAVRYSPGREHPQRGHDGQGYAPYGFQVTHFGSKADRQHQAHQAY